MKVTISFNGTKIVVPCGEGDISVQELTDLAATRYKKAIGKTNAYWVSVHSLKSHEGGILDPDDLICDVCDDREQLAAIYDEQNGGHYHGGGDGMSSASDSDIKESLGGSSSLSSNDTLLQVRRGSEPSLHNKPGSSDNIVTAASSGSVQAVIASINARSVSISSAAASSVTSMAAPNTVSRSLSSNEIIMMQQQQHLRSSLRKTMVNTQFGYFDQSEDQDSRATLQQSSPDSQYGEGCDNNSGSLSVMRRREPLGASGNKPERPKSPSRLKPPPAAIEAIDGNNDGGEVLFDIVIPNEIGPLGVHVVPCDTDGRLIVQGIEPGGRIDRDGRLAVSDCIVAINGYPLQDTTFNKAQEIFKEALYAKELRLKILRNSNTGALISSSVDDIKDHNNAVEGGSNCNNNNTKSNTLTRKTEMAAGTKITTAVNANNTRKIGKLLKISLRKGTQGLGFSITTRDNALGDNTPIYIKNIMPKGAAIEDGTLKPGDRLLEVNNECVDGMSQSDVVTLLKSFSMDSMVNLVISRHAIASEESESNKSPSKATIPSTTTAASSSSSTTATTLASQTTTTTESTTDAALLVPGRKLHFHLDNNDKTDEEPMDSLEPASSMPSSSASPGISSDNYDDLTSAEDFSFPWKQREILTFDIPVHDSERAGLGVSVKGKTSTNKDGVIDLGIFVKSVLHGGAASRDGRLETNDQLVSINGMSLLGKANPFAMETLRKAMHEEGPVPGIISLTVARKKPDDDLQQPHLSRTSNNLARRDSLSSLPTSSDDEIVREYHVTSQPQQQPPAPSSFKIPSTSSLKNTRNPVIDRLMGHGDHAASASSSVLPSNLRNESYYMATGGSHHGHDVTWNGSMLQNNILFPPEGITSGHQNPNSGGSPDSVFIEQPPIITASASTQSVDNDDDTTVTGGDDHVTTRESLTSLVDFYPAFARDQFGRQSMSEKRHATLDAKSTDTYQKRKKAREEREKAKTTTSNWKKSASLESLQMHHEVKMDVNTMSSPYQRANSVRVSRNRGCNESFRAAVDRSYEKDFPEAAVMTASDDFVIQDLGVGHGHHPNHPAALPTSSDQQQPKVVMRRSKSGGQQNEDRKKNRNSKLLRGLGSMFKIGSNSIERTKDTKVMTRKSMPSPETLTNSVSATSIASSSNNASTSTTTMSTVVSSRGQTKSSSDIPSESPNAHWMQQHYQNQQNQMRLHPQQYIPQQPQPHSRSHSQPRYHATARPNEMYEYMPSSMMRPGSRVGIAADPAGSTEIADYDVIQRLQNTHVQPQQPPPPPPSRPAPSAAYHYGYVQQYNLYNQYGYHQQALPQVAHPRTGSNLSSGSSNNGGPLGGHHQQQHHGHHNKHSSRPKSNYYEYEMYNNNPASYMSTASSAASSSNSHYPSNSDHPQLPPGQPHPAMYSLPRSSSGY